MARARWGAIRILVTGFSLLVSCVVLGTSDRAAAQSAVALEAALDTRIDIDMAVMRHMRCGKRGIKSWPAGGDASDHCSPQFR